MMRYPIAILMGMLLLASPALASVDGLTIQAWTGAAEGVDTLRRDTETELRKLGASLEERQNALSIKVTKRKKDALSAKREAEALARRLAVLREREAALSRELDKSRSEMQKIESTVRNNVLQLLSGRHIQPGLLAHPERTARLDRMSGPDRFPPMADISFLMDSLVDTISESGRVLMAENTDILLRDGSQTKARVLRLGAFEGIFVMPEDAGYLVANPETGLSQSAPYVAEEAESEVLREALQGANRLPLDMSGGKILMDPPKRTTVFARLKNGGLFLWPILLIGILGAFLIVERALVLFRIRLLGKDKAPVPGDQSPTARVAPTHAGSTGRGCGNRRSSSRGSHPG